MGAIASVTLASMAVAVGEPTYTTAALQNVKAALDADLAARIAGTAWMVDAATGKVVVSYDDSVIGDKLAALQAATKRFGAAIQFEHLAGRLEPADSQTVGGNAIFGASGQRCSLGFNAIAPSGAYYFITAGHCTQRDLYWYDNDHTTYLGYRAASYYGDLSDYGIVRYTNTTITKFGAVEDKYDGTHQNITHSRLVNAPEYACRSGSTTGRRCGTIINACASVNYGSVTLHCLIRATACAEGGDSGGPLWSGEAALGILSGGTSGCIDHPNGPTYYMPVQVIVERHGIAVF